MDSLEAIKAKPTKAELLARIGQLEKQRPKRGKLEFEVSDELAVTSHIPSFPIPGHN